MTRAFFITGLAMSVVGVMFGSLPELLWAIRTLLGAAYRALVRWIANLVDLSRRLLRRPAHQEFANAPVSDSVGDSAPVTTTFWPSIDESMSAAEATAKLVERTQLLQELQQRQSQQQSDDSNRLATAIGEVGRNLAASVERLERRIHEIDQATWPRRAFGALLVICGTVLMSIGGLLPS